MLACWSTVKPVFSSSVALGLCGFDLLYVSQEDRAMLCFPAVKGFNTGLRLIWALGRLEVQCSGKPLFVSACCRDLAWQPCDSEGSGPPQSTTRGVLTSEGLQTQVATDCPALTSPDTAHGFQGSLWPLREPLPACACPASAPWGELWSLWLQPPGRALPGTRQECIAYTVLRTTAASVRGRKGDGWKACLPFFDISSPKRHQFSRWSGVLEGFTL